jgi:hypothetical protein
LNHLFQARKAIREALNEREAKGPSLPTSFLASEVVREILFITIANVVPGSGPVDIHFSQIKVATRNSTAANDTTVF